MSNLDLFIKPGQKLFTQINQINMSKQLIVNYLEEVDIGKEDVRFILCCCCVTDD